MITVKLRPCHAARWLTCGLLIAAAGARPAAAQAIDPLYTLPLANGTNLIEFSGSFSHYDGFQFSTGQKIPNTSEDQYEAQVRYAHYFNIGDLLAAWQIEQPAAYLANWRVDGNNQSDVSGARQLGAGNTTLSALFWPYINHERQITLYTGLFLSVPDGSYSKYNQFNAGNTNWSGDAQIGVTKGFGRQFSLQADFDADFSAEQRLGFGFDRQVDPTYRIQVWGNWHLSNALEASLGYEGLFGGAWTDTFMNISNAVPRNAERQRIRANVSYRWTPRVQSLLELDHDVQVGGGYQLGIGTIASLRVLF